MLWILKTVFQVLRTLRTVSQALKTVFQVLGTVSQVLGILSPQNSVLSSEQSQGLGISFWDSLPSGFLLSGFSIGHPTVCPSTRVAQAVCLSTRQPDSLPSAQAPSSLPKQFAQELRQPEQLLECLCSPSSVLSARNSLKDLGFPLGTVCPQDFYSSLSSLPEHWAAQAVCPSTWVACKQFA